MFDQVDMMRIVEEHRGDAVVIPVFRANAGWKQVSNRPELDIPVGGAMGKASSFALGLALARPDKKVILFDGDGSLEMNLGALITIAEKQPKNLVHFVVQNGIYASTGGQPIVGQEVVSFAEMARVAGYASTYEFDDLEAFENSVQAILSEDGPVLVGVKTIPEPRLPEERAAERAAAGNRGPAYAYETLKKELERVS